jgi:hypothetical protein
MSTKKAAKLITIHPMTMVHCLDTRASAIGSTASASNNSEGSLASKPLQWSSHPCRVPTMASQFSNLSPPLTFHSQQLPVGHDSDHYRSAPKQSRTHWIVQFFVTVFNVRFVGDNEQPAVRHGRQFGRDSSLESQDLHAIVGNRQGALCSDRLRGRNR